MGDRLIISDNREDPGNPLVLDGQAIDAAARDPLAIGKLQPQASAQRLVDQVWAEGTDPTGGACTTSAAATSTGGYRPLRQAAKTS